MTKQKEIREGLGKIELEVNDLCGILEGHVHLTPQGREKVLQYLTAKDVVIKVDKSLVPDCSTCGGTGEVTYDKTSPSGIFLYETHHTCRRCSGTGKNQDGYVAVEPLIKD